MAPAQGGHAQIEKCKQQHFMHLYMWPFCEDGGFFDLPGRKTNMKGFFDLRSRVKMGGFFDLSAPGIEDEGFFDLPAPKIDPGCPDPVWKSANECQTALQTHSANGKTYSIPPPPSWRWLLRLRLYHSWHWLTILWNGAQDDPAKCRKISWKSVNMF